MLTTHHQIQRLRISGGIPLLSLYAFMAWRGKHLSVLLSPILRGAWRDSLTQFKSLEISAINIALFWGVAQKSVPFTRSQKLDIANCPF